MKTPLYSGFVGRSIATLEKRSHIKVIRAILLLVLASIAVGCGSVQKRPNFVLIFCDDLGAFDLGCTGSERIHTPHIDALRTEGMLFKNAYSSASVCAPSRAALLTGLSLAHCQIRDNAEAPNLTDGTFGGQRPIDRGTETLGRALQRCGYRTGAFGKWGLGGVSASPDESIGHPLDSGFDRFYGILCQRNAHNAFASYVDSDRDKVALDGNSRSISGKQYVPDLCCNEAVKWINSCGSDAFFLYYATSLPHLALQAPQSAIDAYSFEEIPYDGKKGYLAHDRPRAAYAAMVWKIDEAVGRIVAELDAKGLRDNTLIILTSDNGATFELGGFDPKFFESNRGLRGWKGQLYEGGIRVPMIASWPGHIAANSTCDIPVVGYDIFPTMLGIANCATKNKSDGENLAPLMFGEASRAELAQRSPLVWEQPSGDGWQAVRDGDWKLIRRHAKKATKAKFELYDLRVDPSESMNVANAHPEVVERLARVMSDRTESALPDWNYASITLPPMAQSESKSPR